MELNLIKNPIVINEEIINTTLEQPLELDVTLPDFCPNIMKIINCIVTPSLCYVEDNNSRINISGNAVISISYSDEDNNLHTYESKIAYEKSMEVPYSDNPYLVYATPTVNYINCRAVSARRLDMRGAININIHVYNKKEENIISQINQPSVETSVTQYKNNYISGHCSKQFTLKETLIPPDTGEILRILRHSASGYILESKVISGKIIIKGEVFLDVIYITEDNNQPKSIIYTLPFSQIVDCREATEDSLSSMFITVFNSSVTLLISEDSQSIDCQLTLCANGSVFAADTVNVLEDCYSTQCTLTPTTSEIPLCYSIDTFKEDVSIKEELLLGEGVTSVLDLWCKSITATVSCDSQVIINYSFTLGMNVITDDIRYLEKTIDFALPLKLSCQEIIPIIEQSISLKDCFVSGLSVGQCTININCVVIGFGRYVKNIIAINSLEASPLAVPIGNRNNIIVYYPYSKESLWLIAKKYGTTTNQIRLDNPQLTSDYGDKGDVIILSFK